MVLIRQGTPLEAFEVTGRVPEFSSVYPLAVFEERLAERAVILIAEVDGKPVGFKCGYAKSDSVFYSWMGGVLAAHRRSGIAQQLQNALEARCRSDGFTVLEFKTLNKHRAMLMFGLRNDFDIVDVVPSRTGEKKIVLQKTLR